MDFYTICLLAWYFGMAPGKVESLTWTQDEIDRAQAYCEKKMMDPVDYCRTHWN